MHRKLCIARHETGKEIIILAVSARFGVARRHIHLMADRGSRIPGAPPFFKLMAAKMRSDGGSRDTARIIYKQALDQAPDRQSRATAELKLQQLDALDELELINKVLAD